MSVRIPGAEAVRTVVAVPREVRTRITLEAPEAVFVGEPFTVSGTLTDELGNPVRGARVEIFLDGRKVAEATTDERGRYSASISIGTPGTHTVRARFPGAEIPLPRAVALPAVVGRPGVIAIMPMYSGGRPYRWR